MGFRLAAERWGRIDRRDHYCPLRATADQVAARCKRVLLRTLAELTQLLGAATLATVPTSGIELLSDFRMLRVDSAHRIV